MESKAQGILVKSTQDCLLLPANANQKVPMLEKVQWSALNVRFGRDQTLPGMSDALISILVDSMHWIVPTATIKQVLTYLSRVVANLKYQV